MAQPGCGSGARPQRRHPDRQRWESQEADSQALLWGNQETKPTGSEDANDGQSEGKNGDGTSGFLQGASQAWECPGARGHSVSQS